MSVYGTEEFWEAYKDRGHFFPGFQTKRLEVQAPSELFGKNVVEVFTHIKRVPAV